MDKDMLTRWEWVASNVCKLDDARETANKHRGLCNLQAAIHNELGAVLDDCLNVARDMHVGIRRGDSCNNVARTCMDLLVNHLPEVEEWEADDDEMESQRWVKLEQYKYTYVDTLEVKGYELQKNGRRVEIRETHPDSIYCKDGLYRRFWELRFTSEYQLLRQLQPHTDSVGNLETLYKAVLLYVSLMNEQAEVEAVAGALGVSLQEPPQSRPDLPQREPQHNGGETIHPEQETAPEGKLERFMECIPDKNKEKAKRLLQRLIKEGYCTANYEWIASRWRKGKSRLALACFCYLASNYLGLSKMVDAEGNPTTSWKPFEMLFEYDGKNQLMNTKKSYMRTNDDFNPPEMGEIEKRFF